MLNIAGGSYLEYCRHPHWWQLYGSGIRAAAAVAQCSKDPQLFTYISSKRGQALELLSNTFEFTPHPEPYAVTFTFKYFHPLSTPQLDPSVPKIIQAKSLRIEAENILRFGMLEKDAEVHGEWVCYDPQSVQDPRTFGENGSTATHLTIVVNRTEGRIMTGEDQPEGIGRKLITNYSAETALVKCGSLGVYVVTAHDCNIIPAFKTEKVWPIGSGDVFASIYSHYWAEEKLDPVRSTRFASIAVAHYAETQSLPVPVEIIETIPYEAITHRVDSNRGLKRNIYLAGPFFTLSQRWLIEEFKAGLEDQGLIIFSPLHDVGKGIAQDVVPSDINAIRESDILVAILDGLDPGTLFEVGYARALNKPVLAFVENAKGEELKMLEGTSCVLVNDFATAIYKTAWLAFAS